MSKNTNINWTDHTASPWHSCSHGTYTDSDGNEHEHPGCMNCYAERMSKRNPSVLGRWGPDGTRVMSASFHQNCRRWNAQAQKAGKRASVFPSICDPFEDWSGPILNAKGETLHHGAAWHSAEKYVGIPDIKIGKSVATMDDLRRDLFATIDACPHLDFLLLTKRPGNVRKMWPGVDGALDVTLDQVGKDPQKEWFYRPNVHLLTSISDQSTADALIPLLLQCRDLVPVLGVSLEPMVGPVIVPGLHCKKCGYTRRDAGIHMDHSLCGEPSAWLDWVIIGCESGSKRRPMELEWAESVVNQCRVAGVACWVKQIEIDGEVTDGAERFPLSLRGRERP